MKNKSMVSLKSWNILLIFGTTVVGLLLALASSQMQMVSASVESGSNTSNSNQGAAEGCNPITDPRCNTENLNSSSSGASNSNQQAIDHINQAQSAMQNGDTEGAQRHLDLAKQALGGSCSPYQSPPC